MAIVNKTPCLILLIDNVNLWLIGWFSKVWLVKKRMQTIYPEPAVLNWDSVIHKGVTTKDGKPLGYIAAEDEGSIYVLSSHFKEYRIPKIHVIEFDGSIVRLDMPFARVGRYKIL
jgi:hypothetical protein